MIKDAVLFLSEQLEEYLQNQSYVGLTPPFVQLTNMVEMLGTDSTSAVDYGRIGMTLINIEEERITKAQGAVRLGPGGALGKANPELKLNLFVLFAANSNSDEDKYLDSLDLIDGVIRFFQSKNVFTSENSPSLDSKINRIMLDLHSIPLEQQNYIWGSLGAQYLPSVLYKVRILVVQEEAAIGSSTPIVETNINLSDSQ